MRRVRWRAVCCIGALLSTAVPVAARAQSAPPAEASAGDRAVRLGTQGLEAHDAGRFAEAHGRFAEAQSLSPSPVFVLYMARCQRQVGKLLEARARYRDVVAWDVGASAPEAWSRARADARNELAELEPRIPWLEIEVRGARDAEVLVDGGRVAPGRLELDPGTHRVTARAGALRQERVVHVAEGQRAGALVFELAAPAPPLPPPGPPVAPAEGPLWPSLAAFGVAGAALAVGSVTGVMALDASADVKESCDGDACPDSARGRIEADQETVDDLARASTLSFIAAGAFAAAGVVLLVTRPGGGAPAVEARVAPGRLALRGYF